MATRYPGALDRDPNEIPDNIADSDTLDSPNHATIHNNVNGAVLQIEEKLGIGDTTASAGALLHGTAAGTSAWSADPSVVGSLSVAKDSADAVINLTAHHDTEATAAELTLRKSDGSKASPALVDDDAVLGKIMFQGYDGNSYATGAVIQALADGTPADGDMPTELIFQVTPDGGSETPATAMTIKPDKDVGFEGYVGIGTTAPDRHLDIRGSSNPEIRLQSTDGSDPALYFGDESDAVKAGIVYDNSENELIFRSYNNHSAMKIGSDDMVSPVAGAWKAWTPTLTNITIGNGTVYAFYCQFGDVVHWQFRLYLGSTTSFGGSIYISAPVTPDNSTLYQPTGNVWLQEAGSYIYNGHSMIVADDIFFYADDELGTYTRSINVNATIPFTWGTSDNIYAAGWYAVDF